MLHEHLIMLREALLATPPRLPMQTLIRQEAAAWPSALVFLREMLNAGDDAGALLRALTRSDHPWKDGMPLGWAQLQRAAQSLPSHGLDIPAAPLNGGATPVQAWQFEAEAQALRAAFLNWDADPGQAASSAPGMTPSDAVQGLSATRRTYLLLALSGEGVSAESGLVAELQVRRVAVAPHRLGIVPFYRAPACQLQATDAAFDKALELAGRFIADLLRTHQQPADDLAFEWDVRPLYRPPFQPLVLKGASGGAAMLCAALSLVTERLPKPWPGLLCNVDWARVGITAMLATPDGDLAPVDALGQKLNGWSELPPRLQLQPTLFVHDDQSLARCSPKLRPQPGGRTVLDLVGALARHTGLALTEEQAELYALLQQGSSLQSEAEQALLKHVADRSPRYAPSLAAYLLQRFALRATRRRNALGDGGALHVNFVRLQIQPQWLDDKEDARAAGELGEAGRAARPLPPPLPSLQALVDEGFHADPVDQRRADGWLITGRPGAGKTTLLAHYEMTEARRALLQMAQGEVPQGVCIWVDILGAAELHAQGAAAWMRERWEQRCTGLTLAQLLKRHRPRFIFDAINEMRLQGEEPSPSQRGHTARELALWCHLQGPQVERPLFSVRELERVKLASSYQFIQTVALLPWELQQMRQYCEARLGKGNALEPLLSDSPGDSPGDARNDAVSLPAVDPAVLAERRQLQDLLSLPFNLAGQCTLLLDKTFGTGEPAQDRAELMCALVWLALRREVEQGHTLTADELLDETTRSRLDRAQGLLRTRDQLLHLPTSGEVMLGLQRTALGMLRSKGGKASDWGLPESELPCGLEGPRRQAWLRAVCALGFCELLDPGDDTKFFRFTLQTWQEFFGARALLAGAEWPEEQLRTEMRPSGELVLELDLARRESLPPAPVSGWEETMKFAAQLHPQPHLLLARLAGAPHSLALAGRAAAPAAVRQRCERSPAGQQVLVDLRKALIQRSRDEQVDLRHRIEAGLSLGGVGDPRYTPHYDEHSGRLLCLLPDDRHWLHMPAGPHRIGAADDDLEADSDEKPAVTVHLPAFEMAWAPVTNAEFALFIADGGYDPRQPWWQHAEAGRWINGEVWGGWEVNGGLVPAAVRRQPRHWRNPQLNHPALPVVGVSLYEAHAYCQWLTHRLGPSTNLAYRLPTEAEFEAAAKLAAMSSDSGRFDWCNSQESGLGTTSPAGCFPGCDRQGQCAGSAESLRAADLSGNILQWTSSPYTNHPSIDALTEQAIGFDPKVGRVVRSGAWSLARRWCRASSRSRDEPLYRILVLGFRLVRCPIQER